MNKLFTILNKNQDICTMFLRVNKYSLSMFFVSFIGEGVAGNTLYIKNSSDILLIRVHCN